MNTVFVNGLKIYAYHGVLQQERKVGAYFIINVKVKTDFSSAMHTDELTGTISYADICDVIKQEMATPSNLLEHVAGRIAKSLFDRFAEAQSIMLSITKENPPMGMQCDGAGIEIEVKRFDILH